LVSHFLWITCSRTGVFRTNRPVDSCVCYVVVFRQNFYSRGSSASAILTLDNIRCRPQLFHMANQLNLLADGRLRKYLETYTIDNCERRQ
jgi:phosphopantothenate synthetase